MANHPKHPKCPYCNRSMYKTMEKGRAVKKEDPWAYCRNAKCIAHGKKQTDELSADERLAGDEAAPAWEPPEGSEAPAEDKPKMTPEVDQDAAQEIIEDSAKNKKKRAASKKKSKKKPAAEKPAAPKKAPRKKSTKKKPAKAEAKPKAKQPKAKSGEFDTDPIWLKAADKVEACAKNEGNPINSQICALGVKMVFTKLGAAAAQAFIDKYELADKYNIEVPEAA